MPFWEVVYADPDAPDPFGGPAEELVALASELPPHARVLDLGAGAGRNALFLAGLGHQVTAVDRSEGGTAKLRMLAERAGLEIATELRELRGYRPAEEYDLIVAHGVLHLLEPQARDDLLQRMQACTRPGGYNVIAVFTDEIPRAADLAAMAVGLFREGELFDRYAGWQILERRSYVLEDEHPGGHRHRHPINRLVARKR